MNKSAIKFYTGLVLLFIIYFVVGPGFFVINGQYGDALRLLCVLVVIAAISGFISWLLAG